MVVPAAAIAAAARVAVAGSELEPVMETLFLVCLAAVIGYWSFRHGKRLGSRFAYRIGQRHGRRFRKHRRQRNRFLSQHPKRRF